MKLLIVEGNPQALWQHRQQMGATPYHQRFLSVLQSLGYTDNHVAFPADNKNLPDSQTLQTFSGVLLTGSALNVYNTTPEVTNQLDFAEACFAAGLPVYGSCWGLQIAVTVAGGTIKRGENGREFGLARDITLTEKGKQSPFFKGKPPVFDSYCIHEDDTHELPSNTEILAGNVHSKIQALTIHHRKSDFFGVQYHPEFMYEDINFLANFMKEKFIDEGIYSEHKTQEDYLHEANNHRIANSREHDTLEIYNWLKTIA